MTRSIHLARAVACLAAAAALAPARAASFDFEGLADLEPVSTQFAASGLTFANAVALQAGLSLNEFEFPPHSGDVVVSDDGGPVTLTFAQPVAAVGAYFTYAAPLVLTAYGPLDRVLGTVASAHGSNAATSGDAGSLPNEWLHFGSAAGIARLTIAGDPGGASFVLDDLQVTAVPEPAAAALFVAGLLMLALRRRHTGAAQA